MPRNDTGEAAMPPMHDDYLRADPRIRQNRGARRGQEPDATTEPYRIGSGAVSRHTRTGAGVVLADTTVASMAMG